MSVRLLCKSCKDIISPRQTYEIVSCQCGKCEVKALIGKGYAIRGDCSLVDDVGNELIAETITGDPRASETALEPITDDGEAIKELMMNMAHQIEAMENLSSAGQFSPVVNRDLLTVLVLVESLFRIVLKRKPL